MAFGIGLKSNLSTHDTPVCQDGLYGINVGFLESPTHLKRISLREAGASFPALNGSCYGLGSGALSAAEGQNPSRVSLGSKVMSKVGYSGLSFPFSDLRYPRGFYSLFAPSWSFLTHHSEPADAHLKLPSLPWLGRVGEGQGMARDVLADPLNSASVL